MKYDVMCTMQTWLLKPCLPLLFFSVRVGILTQLFLHDPYQFNELDLAYRGVAVCVGPLLLSDYSYMHSNGVSSQSYF